MLDRSRPAWIALCLVITSAGVACTPSPTVTPDRVGVYVKWQGATTSGGFANAPSSQWPPSLLASDEPATGPGCRDDKQRIERELDLQSTACPALQMVSDTPTSGDADVPIDDDKANGDADQPIGDADQPIGDADQPITPPPTTVAPPGAPVAKNANLVCYDLGAAMIVARFNYFSTACNQLVDLGLFHKR